MASDAHASTQHIPSLGPQGVHVWTASLPAEDGVVEQCRDLLSPDERERAGRMQLPSPRDLFVVGRGLLRTLIGNYLDMPPADVSFSYSAFGRPWLPAGGSRPALQFSVSHSGVQIALAFTREARVGIDVERVRTSADCGAIAARFFAPAEQAALASLSLADRIDAFFACWTRKEALLKAVGLGISRGLSRVEVTCRPGDPARLLRSDLTEVDPAGWSLFDLPVPPGYRSALAVSLAEPSVSCIGEAPAACRAISKCYRRGYHRAITPVTEERMVDDARGRCGRPRLWWASNDLVGAFFASTGRAPSTGRTGVLGRVRSLASW
jgi:4'-phosphopantetheinyl transferase